MLIYTSGTTGKPKGAMLSHANLVSAMRLYSEAYAQRPDDERMCFLPLCHVAERVVGVYTAFLTGTRLNFVENPETVPENVREIAPTVFGAVPRIWEKFYSVVTIRVREATGLAQLAYKLAIGIGYKVATLREEGKPVPPHLSAAFWLARVLVLNNIRKAIGVHRCAPADHRRGADLAGPDPLVHGARARDGRGVGPDRVRRHRDLQPDRRREARLDRQAAAGDGG